MRDRLLHRRSAWPGSARAGAAPARPAPRARSPDARCADRARRCTGRSPAWRRRTWRRWRRVRRSTPFGIRAPASSRNSTGRSPGPSWSSALRGRVSSAVAESGKYRSPYGSSSTMRTSARSAHSSSARRLSRPMSSPVGFWKFGTRYSKRTRRPCRAQVRHRVIERGQVDAVVFLRHADQIRQRVPERRDRAGVGRQLDQHRVTRIDQHRGDQVEPLLRSAGDDALLERRADAARLQDRLERLDQRPESARGTVLERGAVGAGEQRRGDRRGMAPTGRSPGSG